MKTLHERLDQMEQLIRLPNFRQNKGLGNEVGYYVFDYPPEHELVVRQRIQYMKNKNSKFNDGYELVVFDLYDIVIEMLEEEGFLDLCYGFEQKNGLDRIVTAIERLVYEENMVEHYIQKNTPQMAVVVLIGVGKCYPFLRSHKVLNNLHHAVDHVPVIMMYPGTYDGQQLVLFSELKDDNYYRAFRLVD